MNKPKAFNKAEILNSLIANSFSDVPVGATAVCRDGTYSFSKNRQGICSGHGGVARWLQ